MPSARLPFWQLCSSANALPKCLPLAVHPESPCFSETMHVRNYLLINRLCYPHGFCGPVPKGVFRWYTVCESKETREAVTLQLLGRLRHAGLSVGRKLESTA